MLFNALDFLRISITHFRFHVFAKIPKIGLRKRYLATDGDRKYMVQTLATVMMYHKTKPCMDDCLLVSRALHTKFRFLGDQSSEVRTFL